MMKKINSIKELNERVWYRILKVIFIGAFILSILVANLGVAISSWPEKYVDVKKTVVHCKEANRDFFLSAIEKNDYLYKRDDLEAVLMPRHIYSHCREVYEKLNPEKIKHDPLSEEEIEKLREDFRKDIEYAELGLVEDKKAAETSPLEDEYKVNFVTYWSTPPLLLGLYAILTTMGICAIFLFIQRLFYYILLGKFRPPHSDNV